MEKISPDYSNLTVYDFEISNRDNILILQKIGQEMDISIRGVPITIIGKDHFVGYYDDQTTGKTITNLIEKYAEEGDPDLVGILIRELESNQNIPTPTEKPVPSTTATLLTTTQVPSTTPVLIEEDTADKDIQIPDHINVPILGRVNIKDLSLPVLTILLGGLDGFDYSKYL